MHRHTHFEAFARRMAHFTAPEGEGMDEMHCGPFGHQGGRGRGHGFRPFGFGGGPGDFGFRAGRKISSKDLQLLLLALVGEKPRHGYDLIKAIEELSNGFYSPSPGVIYPALTYLEEAGDAASEAEGTRKLYHLTEAGRATLLARRAEADGILDQLKEQGRRMDRVREAFSGEESGEEEGFDPFRRGAFSAVPENHGRKARLAERAQGEAGRGEGGAAPCRRDPAEGGGGDPRGVRRAAGDKRLAQSPHLACPL